MSSTEDRFLEAVKKLREEEAKRREKRKFDQTIDLIVNLKEFEVKKNSLSVFVQVPHRIKEKRVAVQIKKFETGL